MKVYYECEIGSSKITFTFRRIRLRYAEDGTPLLNLLDLSKAALMVVIRRERRRKASNSGSLIRVVMERLGIDYEGRPSTAYVTVDVARKVLGAVRKCRNQDPERGERRHRHRQLMQTWLELYLRPVSEIAFYGLNLGAPTLELIGFIDRVAEEAPLRLRSVARTAKQMYLEAEK